VQLSVCMLVPLVRLLSFLPSFFELVQMNRIDESFNITVQADHSSDTTLLMQLRSLWRWLGLGLGLGSGTLVHASVCFSLAFISLTSAFSFNAFATTSFNWKTRD
jgi:hypothetical protein